MPIGECRNRTSVDDCTRECLAIEVDTSITGLRVQGYSERSVVDRQRDRMMRPMPTIRSIPATINTISAI